MKVGFIGLGNVGGKLAGNLLRNDVQLTVLDLSSEVAAPFVDQGAEWASTPAQMAGSVDMVITCLPSVSACAQVVEGEEGILAGMKPGLIWAEMSTTDSAEVRRLGGHVAKLGGVPLDCPVSGGCHRAATGNIAILVGGDRAAFERALPVLTVLGRRVLHTGELGSASTLKVLTNFLATANLVALTEALVTAQAAGLDMNTAYEAIRISSGNSFVHETESQVILNGSRNINFTMDLVLKDIGLFQAVAQEHGVPLELSPLLIRIFEDGLSRFGAREWSPNIIRRLEEACGLRVSGEGFPEEMEDYEPPAQGYEVKPHGQAT